jgi:peptidoglycan/xylan/chitin deacetylase (PgdA/CDA1 family)
VRPPDDLVRKTVKRVAAFADRARHPKPGVVILAYHRVGPKPDSQIHLSLKVFSRQLSQLATSGRVVSLAAAIDMLSAPVASAGEPAPVVLTFDDGTADFTDVVVPLLQRYSVPATLYAATAYIEDSVPFPDGSPPCSWAGLADAVQTGLVEVGSHTHTHRLLDRCDPADVDDELDRSKGLIHDRLGREAMDFANPKAVRGSAYADRAVRARFRSSALAGTRPNVFGHTDVWRLARSPIQQSDGMRWFKEKADGGMRLEDDVRRVLNRARYARATT